LDTVITKTATGNDRLTFRRLHSNSRMIRKFYGKLWLYSNDFPKIRETDKVDDALIGRLVVFDWCTSSSKPSINYDLFQMLKKDEMRDWIFTGLVKEAYQVYWNQLYIDPSFEYTKKRYFNMGRDTVSIFFQEMVKKYDPQDSTLYGHEQQVAYYTEDIYECYRVYCKKILCLRDSDRLQSRAFQMKFAEMADAFGIVKYKDFKTNKHYYSGLVIDSAVKEGKQYHQPNLIQNVLVNINARY
jgi:phage/plasmid-associated DNA primase